MGTTRTLPLPPFLPACLLLLAWLSLSASSILADIAPTRHYARSVFPVDAPDVRMLSAKVDIEWGTPCTLSAVFVMDNQSDRAAEVQLGFPVDLPQGKHEGQAPGFRMSFDDVPAAPADITKVEPSGDGSWPGSTWFRCKHTFPPGRTRVAVVTKLPASSDYDCAFAENLFYVIQTGAAWKGTIGSEEVNIHFPQPVAAAQIRGATPKGYTIEGDTVRWRFTDFEPSDGDHDVELRYLRPDVLPELARLRAEIAKNPADTRAKLTLVKNLVALRPRKESYGIPESRLDSSEYREILAHLKDPRDRATFQQKYARDPDKPDRYLSDGRWSKAWEEVIWRLNRSGYVSRETLSTETSEAKTLLEQLLKEQPHNAEAWGVYLMNYRRFRYVRVYQLGSCYCPVEEEPVETAYRHCPTDPFIRLLRSERARLAAPPNKDETEQEVRERMAVGEKLWNALQAQGVFATSFQK